jgi:uncharacterized membrane protein YphA (DoxX/SURF4 family)
MRRKEAPVARTLTPETRSADPAGRTGRTDRSTLHTTQIPGPPLARWLFKDTRAAWLWLPLRLYVGWSWLQHGLQKVTNPEWIQSGNALAGFWGNAVRTDPKPVIEVTWYRHFIEALLGAQAYTWFADLIVYGEILVGIALILGAFTGLAAFFGAFLQKKPLHHYAAARAAAALTLACAFRSSVSARTKFLRSTVGSRTSLGRVGGWGYPRVSPRRLP